MQKISLVMAFIFVFCAIGIQPVSAQQPEYGYIPLLIEGYDTTLPRQVVSQKNFERMLPLLLEAKSRGDIADFEPDFFGGFVRVTNPSSGLRNSSFRLPIKSEMWDAIVEPLGNQIEVNRDSKLAPRFTVFMYNFSSCFQINTEPDYRVKGILKTSSGEILAASDDTADSSGWLYECFSGTYTSTTPGYVVSFTLFDSGGTKVSTYSTTVPRNTFTKTNNADGIVYGKAPTGLSYTATWSRSLNNATNSYLYQSKTGIVPSSGDWAADFTYSFKGGDYLDIYLKKGVFTFDYYFMVSRTGCVLRGDYCWLTGLPNKPVSMTITHSGTTYSFSGKTSRTGYFYAEPVDVYGDPVLLSPGDKITGTGAVTSTLPTLTMSLNRTANTITGKAPASKYFEVDFDSEFAWDWVWLGSSSTGTYTAAFDTDIPSTGIVYTYLSITIPATGNYTYLRRVFP